MPRGGGRLSFIDKAKEALGEALEKAKEVIAENIDKIEGAIDQAGDLIDEKNGGHFSEPIETMRVEFDAGRQWQSVSPLRDFGYCVGKTRGLPRHQRQDILRRFYRLQLVPTSTWTEDYIRDWGQRCTRERWDRMYRSLEWEVDKAQRVTTRDMSVAISDWEEDLQFLNECRSDWLARAGN